VQANASGSVRYAETKIVPSRIASRGSFKRQIILTFVVGFFLLITVFSAYMANAERKNLYRDSIAATTGLAQSLAVSSLSWVLANDVVGLQEVVRSFQNYPELRYAIVISPAGRVLAHSDATKVGQFISDEKSLALFKAPPKTQTMTDNESMADAAVPISINNRHVGWARIGLGRENISSQLRTMMRDRAFFVLLATALSLLAAMLITNRLGRHIGSLIRVAEEVHAGNFATRAIIPGGEDEITKLADSFNLMLDALARNEKELRALKDDLEIRVAERTAQLATANQDLEGFSYSVSHDLRAPLRAIDGFSLILLEDYSARLDDEGKRLLNVVRDNTAKMARLIDDILLFSRAGRLELALVEVDMEALVRSAWEELAPALGARNVQFEVKALPRACVDHSALAQVVTNLLANAAKFTRPRDPAVIEVGGSKGESENVIYVKDNGVGFDMQYAPKLFGVFQRLHGMDEFEGTGIGLAIVKRVITKHGGRVWAEGKVNEGASFFFALPRREPCQGGKP